MLGYGIWPQLYGSFSSLRILFVTRGQYKSCGFLLSLCTSKDDESVPQPFARQNTATLLACPKDSRKEPENLLFYPLLGSRLDLWDCQSYGFCANLRRFGHVGPLTAFAGLGLDMLEAGCRDLKSTQQNGLHPNIKRIWAMIVLGALEVQVHTKPSTYIFVVWLLTSYHPLQPGSL